MSDFLQRTNVGSFYVNSGTETVVDPFGPPIMQNQLLDQLRSCDQLVQLDFRYAKIVQGASKMPWNMVWAARNQDEPVTDADLAELRDLAWNEIIKKRYLPSLSGTATVGETTASMLEIVRDMNLQRRRFQIMGLHEQVEACEIHLVLQLCQAGVLFSDRYRVMANRFRRHDKLFEAFGLAVGAYVCASAPFTLGSGMARYERDLQFEYRKNATALFVWVLQQNMAGLDATAVLDEDYVARISRLIVVWPDDDDSRKRKKRIGFEAPKKDDEGGSARINMLLDAVAGAQGDADHAKAEISRIHARIEGWQERAQEQIENERRHLDTRLAEKVAETKDGLRDFLSQQLEAVRIQAQIAHEGDFTRVDGRVARIAEAQRTELDRTNTEIRRISARLDGLNVSIQEIRASDSKRGLPVRESVRPGLGDSAEVSGMKREIEEMRNQMGELSRKVDKTTTKPKARSDRGEDAEHSSSENVIYDNDDRITQIETTLEFLKGDMKQHIVMTDKKIRGLQATIDKLEERMSTQEYATEDMRQLLEQKNEEQSHEPMRDMDTRIQSAIQSDRFRNDLKTQIAESVKHELAIQLLQSGRREAAGQAAGAVDNAADIQRRLDIIENFLSLSKDDETTAPTFDSAGPLHNAQFHAPGRGGGGAG